MINRKRKKTLKWSSKLQIISTTFQYLTNLKNFKPIITEPTKRKRSKALSVVSLVISMRICMRFNGFYKMIRIFILGQMDLVVIELIITIINLIISSNSQQRKILAQPSSLMRNFSLLEVKDIFIMLIDRVWKLLPSTIIRIVLIKCIK